MVLRLDESGTFVQRYLRHPARSCADILGTEECICVAYCQCHHGAGRFDPGSSVHCGLRTPVLSSSPYWIFFFNLCKATTAEANGKRRTKVNPVAEKSLFAGYSPHNVWLLSDSSKRHLTEQCKLQSLESLSSQIQRKPTVNRSLGIFKI
jgi:hypothetical protein